MNVSSYRLILPAALAVLSSCTVMDLDESTDEEQAFSRPDPKFPESEFLKRRDGWVVVKYRVSRGGIVGDARIALSSGNDQFEAATLEAVSTWRYPPGQQAGMAVLVSFIGGGNLIRLSDEFIAMYSQAEALLGDGQLGEAKDLVAAMRETTELHPSELAYWYLLRAQIAGESGDSAAQLDYVRRAMLKDGMWLAHAHYIDALGNAVVLAIAQDDLASAIRDYEMLLGSPAGRDRAAELEEIVKSARIRNEADPLAPEPWVAADRHIVVTGSSIQTLQSRPEFRRAAQPPVRKKPSRPPPSRPRED